MLLHRGSIFRLLSFKNEVTHDQANELDLIRPISRGTRMIGTNILDIHTDPDFFYRLLPQISSQGIGNEDGFVLSGVSRLNLLKKKLSAQ